MTNYAQYDDVALLPLLAQSDEAAFTEIYNRYWEKLFYVAWKRLQSAEDAKEVVQNVFVSLWQKRATLNIEFLPVYLAAMVRYAVYRQWGREQRRDTKLKIAYSRSEKTAGAFDIDNRHLLDILAKFAETLPEKYRVIFISHKLLDRPLDEVAEQLGVSVRTAEGYVLKVMELMRNHREKMAFSILLATML